MTDSERLDYLEQRNPYFSQQNDLWIRGTGYTLRQAIDAAIKGERVNQEDLTNEALKRIEGKIDSLTSAVAAVAAQQEKIMLGLTDIQSADTTLHADLVSENGLITQILAAVASGQLNQAGAQALITSMNADDSTAKSNIAAITAALTPPATTGA